VQASHIVGVSPQFLIGLLKKGDISHHLLRTQQLIYVRDFLSYQAKRDANHKKDFEDLIRAEIADGIFDDQPVLA
jgi:hypothetical protein